MSKKSIGKLVAQQGGRPEIPAAMPPPLRQLMEECWAQEPLQRPLFPAICARLAAIRIEMGDPTTIAVGV